MLKEQDNNWGVRLLRKGQRGILHAVFSRFGVLFIILLLQFLILFTVLIRFREFLPQYAGLSTVLSILLMLYLLNSDINPTSKITWLIISMIAPIVGLLFFVFTRMEVGHRLLKSRLEHIILNTKECIIQDGSLLERVKEENPKIVSLHHYLNRSGCFPIYDKTRMKYLSGGEIMFETMLKELEAAKDYIFMEYFIIDEGYMWGKVLGILKEKAKEGVEIRVMYDGTCEFALLPHDYPKRLKKLGIQCKVFAPISPFVSTHYNYRDHRKIMVIDGHTAFTGGINIADEYINKRTKYGHWKDSAIMLQGEAVKSFTLMFLQMWNVDEKKQEYMKYLKENKEDTEQEGYVIPYSDWPLDDDKVGECVYIDILNHADEYVHIMSP